MNKTSEPLFYINADWLALRSILALAAGVLLWFFPDDVRHSVVLGVGVLLLVAAVVSLVFSYNAHKGAVTFYLVAAGSVLLLILGLLLVLKAHFFEEKFLFVAGACIMALAVMQVFELLHLSRYKGELSPFVYLAPLLLLALGVLVMSNPAAMVHLVSYFAAAALVGYGICGVLLAVQIKLAHRKFVRENQKEEKPEANPQDETLTKNITP